MTDLGECRWCDGWGTITTHRTGTYKPGTRADGAKYWSRLDTERCTHCDGTGGQTAHETAHDAA